MQVAGERLDGFDAPPLGHRQEGTGEYVDDTLITTKVKAAGLNEPTLKSAEINVETFKGVVQLSRFLSSQSDISKAVKVAREVLLCRLYRAIPYHDQQFVADRSRGTARA